MSSVTIPLPANFSSLSIDQSGRVDVGKVLGTAQTARDLGANIDTTVSSRAQSGTTGTDASFGSSQVTTALVQNTFGTKVALITATAAAAKGIIFIFNNNSLSKIFSVRFFTGPGGSEVQLVNFSSLGNASAGQLGFSFFMPITIASGTRISAAAANESDATGVSPWVAVTMVE